MQYKDSGQDAEFGEIPLGMRDTGFWENPFVKAYRF